MKKKRLSVEQIAGVLKQAEVGVLVAELICKVGISEQTFYRWKKQSVGKASDKSRTKMRCRRTGAGINAGCWPTSIKVCKASMRRFDPGPRLQHFPLIQCFLHTGPFQAGVSISSSIGENGVESC